jgi:hypothetical protein
VFNFSFVRTLPTPHVQHCYFAFLLFKATALLFLLEAATLLFLLDMLLYSSFLTYYSTCLVRFATMLLLLDVIALLVPHYCSTPFAWCGYSFCSMLMFFVCLGTSLLHPWFCYSLFLLFYIGIHPLHFFTSQRIVQIRILQVGLGRWKLFFFIFVCWWVFLIIHVFGKWWLTMYLFILCRNYLDIVHLIIHIASQFYTLHFICTILLKCIFSTNCIYFLKIFQLLDFHISCKKHTYF